MILTLFMALIVQLTFAQQKTVSGTVSDENGLPLIGATVVISGTSSGTTTDFDGNYKINASSGDVLNFSYVGYSDQNITVGASNTINTTLQPDNTLDEVIVTAFGTTTKEAFTGSASTIGVKDLESRIVTSAISAIEGKATGVQFTSPTGPGSSPGIVIRGVGTLNGSSDPLYIVDGVQFEGALSSINQADIESFTILKDAASTSLYGSRAANGVIIITTKKGTRGGIKVNATSSIGFVSRAIDQYDRTTPGQYYELSWEALKNSVAGQADPNPAAFASANIYNSLAYNPFNVPNDQIVGTDGRINPNAQVIYKSLDWIDELERAAIRRNYGLSVSGGGDDHSVFFSASYLDEESYVVKSKFKRITTRLNADLDVSDHIKIGGSANITLSEAIAPSGAGGGGIVNPFSFAQNLGSIYPIYVNDLQGNIVLDELGNSLFDNGEGFALYNIGSRPRNQGRHALQELLLNDERDEDNQYGFRMFTDVNLFEGFNVRVTYARDISDNSEREFENAIIGDAQPDGRLSQERVRRDIENFNQVITYNKSFGNHNVDITAGHESYEEILSNLSGLATKQTATGINEFENFPNIVDLSGQTNEKALEGYFLRANYNYDNKYYLSGSVRRDASSIFQTRVRKGTFYSVGGSWIINKESFMKNVSFVNRLKLRSSYGEVGNDNLLDFFLSQARFDLTSNAASPAILLRDLGNSNLKWETIENFDAALEFSLFENLIDGSVEYYKRNTTDLLYNLPIAPSNGISEVPVNAGELFNSGWEIELTGHLFKNSEFNWNITLQGSTLKNEITDLPTPFVNGSKRWAVGHSRYDWFLFHTAGVDPENGDQLYSVFEEDASGESVPVLDTNGAQQTTNNPDDTIRAYTGTSSIPDFIGSISNTFSYKNFTLDVLVTYGIGGEILDDAYAGFTSSQSFGRALHPDLLNAWRQPGDITDIPRLESGNTDLQRTLSTRFLTDASFWTIKNVNLSYSFRDTIVPKSLGVDNLVLSLVGENLYVNSKRTGLDPQFALSGRSENDDFAAGRIISLGLNVSF